MIRECRDLKIINLLLFNTWQLLLIFCNFTDILEIDKQTSPWHDHLETNLLNDNRFWNPSGYTNKQRAKIHIGNILGHLGLVDIGKFSSIYWASLKNIVTWKLILHFAGGH